MFPGQQVNVKVDNYGDVTAHYLVAPRGEPDPDANHIHLKSSIANGGAYIVAAVKVDGIREINRRELVEAINQETGLNLDYRNC